MRERIDVSEIEAQTKIRAKYLRALENEEWGLLPGPTFVKSFLRTYAQALGLDGKALVEEYRLQNERSSEAFEPIVSTPRRKPQRTGPSRGYVAAVVVVGALIVLLVVLLATGGGSSVKPGTTAATVTVKHGTRPHRASGVAPAAAPRVVALSLKATALVYVCLLGEHGRKLVSGQELQPGESTPTFHSRSYEMTLGNSSVTMFIDGRPRSVPPSSQPIGYTVTHANGRRSLPASQLPTCT